MNKLRVSRMEVKEESSKQQINPSTLQIPNSHELFRFDEVKNLIDTIEYQDDATLKSSLCIITLKNGYKIIAKSRLDIVEAFDQALSQKLAYYSAMTDVCRAAQLLMLERRYQGRQSDLNDQYDG